MPCMSANHLYCSLWMTPSILDDSDLSARAAHAFAHTQRGLPEALVSSSRFSQASQSLISSEEVHAFPRVTL